MVVKSDGTIWFTDPPYGILTDLEGWQGEPEYGGCHVFCLDPTTGELQVVADDFVKPNGIAFSPDEKILYVADTGASHDPDGPRHIRAFDVGDDGRLEKSRVFATCDAGLFDGFRSTPRAASGPAPATACIASRPTARCSARSWCPRWWPTSASAGSRGTASISAARPASMPC